MKVHAHFVQKNGGDPTQEWLEARIGKITASEFGEIVTLKGELRKGKTIKTYLHQKLEERWTGRQCSAPFFSQPVENGIVVEEKAAAFAALEYGLDIQHVGFVEDGHIGCSPDGLVGWKVDWLKDKPTDVESVNPAWSGLEIKCPALNTHIGYLLSGGLPDEYKAQVQGSMFVTGCATWHFLSYSLACYLDGFYPLHVVVERDEEFCKNLADSLMEFTTKYDTAFNRLVELNGAPPPRRQKMIFSTATQNQPNSFDLMP